MSSKESFLLDQLLEQVPMAARISLAFKAKQGSRTLSGFLSQCSDGCFLGQHFFVVADRVFVP
jgi:hypothetical protein